MVYSGARRQNRGPKDALPSDAAKVAPAVGGPHHRDQRRRRCKIKFNKMEDD